MVSPYSAIRRGTQRSAALGFTLLEAMVVFAALMILLGLMVSMTRHVRSQSREQRTRRMLSLLDRRLSPPLPEGLPRQLTSLTRLVEPREAATGLRPTDDMLLARAHLNSQGVVLAYRKAFGEDALRQLSISLYDGRYLRDAWHTPVVYMGSEVDNLDLPRQKRAFFMSAGPDRRFSTVADNLYSYERPWEEGWNR